MTEYRIIKTLAQKNLDELGKLYIDAGWLTPDDDQSFLTEILSGSAVAAAAFDGDRLIGFARALSDGCSDGYIQDVTVSSKFRKQGIGTELIRTVEKALRDMGVDWIALVGEPGTEKFYRDLGLSEKRGFTLWKFN